MFVDKQLGRDLQRSFSAIYTLGHSQVPAEQFAEEWELPIDSYGYFEIGVWDPVPVKPRKNRKRKKVREESINDENIDYESHLHEDFQVPERVHRTSNENEDQVRVLKPETSSHECFCYVCLIRYDLSPNFPLRMLAVTTRLRTSRLMQVALASKNLFRKLVRKVKEHEVKIPEGLYPRLYIYKMALTFFEVACRKETMDIAVVLNDHVQELKRRKDAVGVRNLHEMFRTFVYASASKLLFVALSVYLNKDQLRERSLLSVAELKKVDPLGFLQINLADYRSIATNFMRLYNR